MDSYLNLQQDVTPSLYPTNDILMLHFYHIYKLIPENLRLPVPSLSEKESSLEVLLPIHNPVETIKEALMLFDIPRQNYAQNQPALPPELL